MKATGISTWKICALALHVCFSLPLTAAHNEGKPDLDNTERAQVEEDSTTSPNVDSSDSNLYRELVQETDPEKLKNLLGQAPPEELEALRNQLEAQETLSPVQEQVLQSLKDKQKEERTATEESSSKTIDQKSGQGNNLTSTRGVLEKLPLVEEKLSLMAGNHNSSSEKSSTQTKPEVSGKPLEPLSDYHVQAPNGRLYPFSTVPGQTKTYVAPVVNPNGTVNPDKAFVFKGDYRLSTTPAVVKSISEIGGIRVDRQGNFYPFSNPPVAKNPR